MILLKELVNEIEMGKTAMSTKTPAPAVVWLYDTGKLNGNILDYGAGFGRNTVYLRSKGLKVYSYDPFNGKSVDGYTDVSNVVPTDKFDVGFTSFVLNVTDKNLEKDIINKVSSLSSKSYHIVRNKDVSDMISGALNRKDKTVTNSFIRSGFDINTYTDDDITKFSAMGTDTFKGFQRILFLENDGFQLLKITRLYKIYTK